MMQPIAKGTAVRVRTTNGGDSVGRLLQPYRPTYHAVVAWSDRPDDYTVITAGRLRSIEPLWHHAAVLL
jgi:hypothetical protein